jgi:hypothetical protein
VTTITSRSRNRTYYSKLRKEAAMRQALSIAVVATLLIATIVEVVAAGGRTVVARSHFYYAVPASGINVAVPRDMKSFPTDLLPQ